MKKAVCLALILCILTSITSCTGYKKLSEIKATDYFSGIECSIPLSIPSGAMTSEFLHTDDDIDEIKARLDKISSKEGSFTVQYLPYNALLIVYTKDSKNALYLFQEYQLGQHYQSKYSHQYRFSDFSAYLTMSLQIGKVGLKSQRLEGIPIPHHLLRDEFTGSYYDYLEDEYVVNGSIEEFYEFYQMFQNYYSEYSINIEKEDNTLILKNLPVNIKYINPEGNIDHKIEQILLKEFRINFSKNDNSEPVVTFSYIIT
ncbi:hypothetical protein [Acetivibrio clariflavus]|uniref:hypothetical protein n=1 Tax=Acetivibrio clariflavus TaxID=288965 RepID=UPI00048921FE|nr:hypothetical protein [Acetivibrio clariflavus]NLL05508.1 hypothetical protein [Clostridiaceae bacterium]